MQSNGIVFIALAFAATGYAQAQDLSGTCHASSSYDLTVASDSLVFDRAGPAPRQIQLHNGKLGIDGAPVHLNTEDRDRLALFEQQLRALVPKARGVADNGVDLAVKAVRAETAGLGVSADTQAQLDAKLAARGAELKRRIAASISAVPAICASAPMMMKPAAAGAIDGAATPVANRRPTKNRIAAGMAATTKPDAYFDASN